MATEMPLAVQEARKCGRCLQVDDHPRHGVGIPAGMSGKPVSFHLDCHAQLGCPICLHQLRDADGAQGSTLREHLLTLPPLDADTVASLVGEAAPTALEG